jgi:GNAT superfamily N-acetyltransferase
MEFLPFDPAHAALVANWPRSAQEAEWWCGAGPYPVPAQTVADWQQEADVHPHMLLVDGTIVAYGETWVDAGEGEVELARIIVAPAARGTGVGRALVRGLLSEAAKTGYPDVLIRVNPANETALHCYQAEGFQQVAPELARAWNAGQPVSYTWLRHTAPKLPHDRGELREHGELRGSHPPELSPLPQPSVFLPRVAGFTACSRRCLCEPASLEWVPPVAQFGVVLLRGSAGAVPAAQLGRKGL